jgi:hypothetical protein
MYAGEPTTVPVRVRVKLLLVSKILLMPKSRIFAMVFPSGSRCKKMFAGLRSRWMIPCECARSSAFATHWKTSQANSGSSVPLALQPRVEPFAVEQLEHQERRAVLGLTEVEDLDDARASHAPARLGLVEEALQGDRVLGDVRGA